ncbi:hypothetical protein BDEG_22058 [Batrachochytrium dendrobatidis JEL423]|nr:hypothetical protein BDEG_22058 [Batrachochytrium dendrobatidis JEL423]
MEQYPYFKTAGSGWKNSIRHNLSLNKNFVRVARPANERGKGAYWTLSSTSFPKKGRSRHRSVSDPNRGIAQGIISSMKNGDGTSPLESGHGTPVSQFEAISNQQSMLSQQSQSGQLQSQQLGYHLIPTELFPRGSPDFTAGMNSFDKHQTMMDPLRSFQDNLNSTSISGSTSIHTLDNIGAIHTSIGQLANTAAVNGEPIGQGRHPSLLRRHTYQNGRTLPPEIVGLRRTLDGNIQFGSSGLFESEYDNTVANGAMNQGMTTPVAGTTATMETATSPTALANAAVAHSAMQQRFARARSASFHYLPGFFPSQLSYHDLGLAHGNNQVMYDSHGAMHDPKYINEIITEEEGHTMQSGAMFQPNFFNGDPSNLIKSDANNLNVRVNPTGVVGSGGFNNQQQTWLGAPSQEHSYNDLSMTAFPDTNSSVGLINPSISQQSTAGYFSYQRNASDLEGLSELPEESEVTNIYNMKPNDRQSIGAGVAATSAATTFNEQRRNTVSAMPDQSGFPMNLQRRTSFQQGTPMSQFALPGHIAQPPQLTEGLAGVPGRLELGQRGNAEGYSWEGYA